MKNLLLLIALIAIISSCSPTKTIVDTSCAGYKSTELNRELLASGGIGIMPVLGGAEREQYRRPMGDAIYSEFKNTFGDEVKSTNDVIKIINDNNIANDYTSAINNYTTSGIVPKEMVQNLGNALNVDYLLYTRLLTDREFGEIYTGRYTTSTINVDELYVQTQVWDTNIGDVVWEGKGGVAKLPADPSDVVSETAKGLAQVVGLPQYEGPCQEPSELIQAVQSAASNTYLAIAGVSLAFSLLILVAL